MQWGCWLKINSALNPKKKLSNNYHTNLNGTEFFFKLSKWPCSEFLYGGVFCRVVYQIGIGAYPKLICVCELQTQITKKLLTRHKLVLRVQNPVANRKYL
jgi:hypothetical protein